MGRRRTRLHRRQPARRGTWARSSCCPKASRGCSCRAVRRRTVVGALRAGRIAGRRTRCIRRRARIRPCSRSAPSSTCSAPRPSIPIVCTTYRLTEHFHYWTKNNPYSMQLQPEFFVEMPVELARGEGHRQRRSGARDVGARLDRGRAMVTRADQADAGRRTHGLPDRIPDPLGLPRPRRSSADRSPISSRRPSSTRTRSRPEYKGFLVKLEKV